MIKRFCAISDIHCHNHEAFSTRLANGRNSRFQSCLDVLEEFTEYCGTNNIELAIILGDLFHSRTKIDIDVFTSTYLAIQKLSSVAEVVLLCGNHDQSNRIGDLTSLEPFKAITRVIDSPTVFTSHGLKIAAHPATVEHEDFKAFANSVKSADLFLCHQAISGAKVGPYDTVLAGDIAVDWLPKKVKYTIAGDLHTHQEIGENVVYCGSPYMLDFGERDHKKGFLVFNTADWSYKLVETHAPRFQVFDTPEALCSSINRGDTDLHRDFVRGIQWSRTAESEALEKQYPRLQVIYADSGEEVSPLRIATEALGNDADLVKSYTELYANGLDQERCNDLAMSLLRGDEE